MTKIISIFNNKGGVEKTTCMYHVAHMLSRCKLSVLTVDCDSQCGPVATIRMGHDWPRGAVVQAAIWNGPR
jgi:cellulose biosynthesis protein BcsQ